LPADILGFYEAEETYLLGYMEYYDIYVHRLQKTWTKGERARLLKAQKLS
jgi:hypothetical protein